MTYFLDENNSPFTNYLQVLYMIDLQSVGNDNDWHMGFGCKSLWMHI
jgi:hypothetical protein